MQTVQNASDETRVWPGIVTAEGVTLELDSGESAEVEDLPEDFEDAHLQVAAPSVEPAPSAPAAKTTPPAAPTTTTDQEPQP